MSNTYEVITYRTVWTRYVVSAPSEEEARQCYWETEGKAMDYDDDTISEVNPL